MSEYQRYEFMTVDRPLTRAQLDAVNKLSSHIEASSTHALIEYHHGDFKYDPIDVLHKYFDGFLYWANWGSPQFALRFPHGVLPRDIVADYEFDDTITFTPHKDYDILDIHFSEMEGPDEWIEHELSSLIAIRDELMQGDLRSLYIVWLAGQHMMANEDDDNEVEAPPVPPAFGKLTEAQWALAVLLQLAEELLVAAAQHSSKVASTPVDDFAAWIELLPQNRQKDYLIRLARNEPGLSRLLIKDLRELGLGKTKVARPAGERVPYSTLFAESRTIHAQRERERLKQERAARERHLQDIHAHQDTYWRQVDIATGRGTGVGYDEALRLLIELRDAADQFKETQEFQNRFSAWIRAYLRRPALIKRLEDHKFPVSEA